jgi:hypothetical protein
LLGSMFKVDALAKSPESYFSSFRRKPESSSINKLQNVWTPAFAGVTTFCESIKVES